MIREVLSKDDQIHNLSQELYQQRSLLVMGRGFNYATCLEGALVSTMSTIVAMEAYSHNIILLLKSF